MNDLSFWHYKEQREQRRCTIDTTEEKNQINVEQGIIPYFLFIYEEQLRNISLFIPRDNQLREGEILDNKNFYKINQSKFLLTTLTRSCRLKH